MAVALALTAIALLSEKHPHRRSRAAKSPTPLFQKRFEAGVAAGKRFNVGFQNVTLPKGRYSFVSFTSPRAGIDRKLTRYMNAAASKDRDVYQFGVYTGNGLKKIAARVRGFGHLWGFDSFQGLPEESSEEQTIWAGLGHSDFGKGGFSAADALGQFQLNKLMRFVYGHVNRTNTTLIPGFFNESLNEALLRRHPLQPALLVDCDADLYVSTVQSLDWMFAHRLIVPGTFVRYDDWPRYNGSKSSHAHNNYFGQARAHYEMTQKYGVAWKLVTKAALQVVSVGDAHCDSSLCSKAPPLDAAIGSPPPGHQHLPFWGDQFKSRYSLA